MVNFTDLKFRDSTSQLGGAMQASEIQTGTPNNMFVNHSRDQLIAGSDKYKCFYLYNSSAETMENFKIWISNGTPLDHTQLWMAFDAVANPFDGSVGFNGTNSYLACGNDSALWSKALTKFSFATWIWPQAGWDTNFRRVVQHDGGSAQGFECYIDDTNAGWISFNVRNAAGSARIATSDDLVLNDWNHVACSYDNTLGSGNVKIYVNGVEGLVNDGVSSDLTETINKSAELRLADSSNDFQGYMKDFKWWSSQSINSTEAEELYDNNELENSTESYHLRMGEMTGTTTKDRVSNTKTATLTNGAFWKTNAMSIGDTFTHPEIRANHWYVAGEIPTGTFNIKPGLYYPIWCRLVVDADATAEPFIDDNAIFTIKFDITSTGTPSTGSGGSGGGTGGSTGGTTTQPYKIAFAGDWGNTGDTTDVVNLMKNQDYDFIVGLGDNAYDDSSASSWCNKFNTFKSKMESAFGNHEYEEDGGIGPYKNFFGYSKTYNSFRFQNCLILILDSNDDKSGVDLNAQRTWAKAELEKYKNDSKVVWRIACMHHPWFGSGGKHDENEFDQVDKFHKLFTDYDVSLVYTGHNHNWHRSHQVAYDSNDPTSPNIVDSSSPYVRTANGLIQVNSGTGGHDGPGDFYSLPNSTSFWAYRNKDYNGVHEIVASNNGNTLTCRFRNTDNDTFDTFTLTA